MFQKIVILSLFFLCAQGAFAVEQIKGGVSFDEAIFNTYENDFHPLNYSIDFTNTEILSEEDVIPQNQSPKFLYTNFQNVPDKYQISLSTGKISNNTEKSEELQQLLNKNPNNKEILLAYAIQLKKEKNFEQALNTVNKILKTDTECALAHFLKGDILRNMGDLKYAVEEYLYTAQLNPYCSDAYYNIAKILEILNDRDLALDYYKMAYQINPSDTEIGNIIIDNYIDL